MPVQLIYQPVYLRLVLFIDSLQIQTSTDFINVASFVLLFAPLFHPHKFQVTAPNYLEDSLQKLKSCTVYQGHNWAANALSDEHNITVQFLIILTL
jgi:hypothetical protein